MTEQMSQCMDMEAQSQSESKFYMASRCAVQWQLKARYKTESVAARVN